MFVMNNNNGHCSPFLDRIGKIVHSLSPALASLYVLL